MIRSCSCRLFQTTIDLRVQRLFRVSVAISCYKFVDPLGTLIAVNDSWLYKTLLSSSITPFPFMYFVFKWLHIRLDDNILRKFIIFVCEWLTPTLFSINLSLNSVLYNFIFSDYIIWMLRNSFYLWNLFVEFW